MTGAADGGDPPRHPRRATVTAAACLVVGLVALCPAGVGAAPTGTGSGTGSHASSEAGLPPTSGPAPGPTGEDRAEPARNVGRFVVSCPYSHSGPHDPIVHPGHAGMSHLHDFFGNVTTDADSTVGSLAAADTTCFTMQDRAAYWVPALYDDDERIVPTIADAYYRAAPGVDPTAVVPYPFGLKVLAGDPTSTEPQPVQVIGWACGRNDDLAAVPPRCSKQKPLTLHVLFPDCWDGEHLDSADHRSHLAYSVGGACGTAHPVHVPQLELAVRYPFWDDPGGLRLASGELTTAHADFFNAWEPDQLATEVAHCIGRDAVCGHPSL